MKQVQMKFERMTIYASTSACELNCVLRSGNKFALPKYDIKKARFIGLEVCNRNKTLPYPARTRCFLLCLDG
jgi:hypothetical protein